MRGMIRRITRGRYNKPNLTLLTGKSTHHDPRIAAPSIGPVDIFLILRPRRIERNVDTDCTFKQAGPERLG